MDLNEIMNLCKGEDKTEKISRYNLIPAQKKICLVYHSNGREYCYGRDNVDILFPESINCDDCLVYYKGKQLFNFEKVLLFQNERAKWLRIFIEGGGCISGYYGAFKILKNAASSERASMLLEYFKNIAQYVGSKDNLDENSFLANVYAKMTFVHPESVLATFLESKPIHKNSAGKAGTIFPFKFNLSQKAALENALSYPVSIIKGPPGTGKTQTILNIIANIIADQGKSVAVVSFNNEAVKNVKTKLEKNGYGFLVADLGNSEKRKNFFANQPSAQVENWNHSEGFTSLRQTLQKHSQKLDYLHAVANRCAEVKRELAAYLLEQEYFLQFRKSSEAKPVRALPFYKSAKTPANKILDCLTDIAITEKLSSITKFCHKLKLLLKYRIYAFNKLNPVGIDQILHMQEKFYSAKINELELELSTKEALLKRQSFNELTLSHQQLSEHTFQKLLYEIYAKLEKSQFTSSNYLANFKDFLKIIQ